VGMTYIKSKASQIKIDYVLAVSHIIDGKKREERPEEESEAGGCGTI